MPSKCTAQMVKQQNTSKCQHYILLETKKYCVTVRHKMRVSQCPQPTAPTFWQSASQVLTLRPQALFKQLVTIVRMWCLFSHSQNIKKNNGTLNLCILVVSHPLESPWRKLIFSRVTFAPSLSWREDPSVSHFSFCFDSHLGQSKRRRHTAS